MLHFSRSVVMTGNRLFRTTTTSSSFRFGSWGRLLLRRLQLLLLLLVLRQTFSTTAQATTTTTTSSTSSRTAPPPDGVRSVVVGVDGGTESIRACVYDAFTGEPVSRSSCASSYPTRHPHPGWAEQNPHDWYSSLGQAVRNALQQATRTETKNRQLQVCAICIDTTCCSVVALDSNYEPLRPCLLWMDQRSAAQTQYIMDQCKQHNGDPALLVNAGGQGPISAEWMTPKALWIKQHEPHVWERATTICEYQDYINYKLTGIMCASSCNAASRWHWDGEECIQGDGSTNAGKPVSLYEKIGIPELLQKLPSRCIQMGSIVGTLTSEAAAHLGIPTGTPVVQGGPDAFVGMIGLGCIQPGQLCLITGSSHLHCVVTAKATTSPGTWGAYRGAPLPGLNFAEGGQSSTGSILRWSKRLMGDDISYALLDQEAAQIPPGSDGLTVLETFQGSRTPLTDPLARGAIFGLTLSHTRAHLWRALMEAVCFGTRACIESLEQAGHVCDEIIMAGGATRSEVWLQMHADVTNKPIVLCENLDAPLLGSAILASVGAGIHKNVNDAVQKMVRIQRRILPDRESAAVYDYLFSNIYSKVYNAAKPVAQAINQTPKMEILTTLNLRGGSQSNREPGRDAQISPSLLAADWGCMNDEIQKCKDCGLNRFHVDIFDGVFLDSPHALTFGPKMVEAIRQKCNDNDWLDLHVCVDRPSRYVEAMAKAGGNCFIFQIEATDNNNEALEILSLIRSSGMEGGVSINPSTPIESIFPLLESGLVSVVDILAVEPGFGGQVFQPRVLSKIEALNRWKSENEHGNGLRVMVDGGVNNVTAKSIHAANVDIMVSGSFLFQHPKGMQIGIRSLRKHAPHSVS